MSTGGIYLQRETYVLIQKHITAPLCSRQIPRGFTRDRTWSSAVRGKRNDSRQQYINIKSFNNHTTCISLVTGCQKLIENQGNQ